MATDLIVHLDIDIRRFFVYNILYSMNFASAAADVTGVNYFEFHTMIIHFSVLFNLV